MINIADKLHASTEQGYVADASQIEGLEEMISSIVQPEEEDVVEVLTYSSSAPESPSDGDRYINSGSNKLFVYDGTELDWVEETPAQGILYLTDDTSTLYSWNGQQFVAVTDADFIPVKNLTTDLEPYTTNGIYTVRLSTRGIITWYTLVVSSMRVRSGLTTVNRVIQTLTWRDGWSVRTKTGSTWDDSGNWTTHEYAYKIPVISSTTIGESSLALQPNTLYKYTSQTADCAFSLAAGEEGKVNEYHIILTIPSGTSPAPSFTWGGVTGWNGGSAPTITAGKTYEVSIMEGIAAFMEI